MSTPNNPLSKFRTYTYYHILIICDNVETAENVSQSDIISEYLKTDLPISAENVLVEPKTRGRYIIMSNGLTNARYNISNLKWDSVTGKFDSNSDNFTSMETEGAFTLIEPKGIKFFNEIQNAYAYLNSNPLSCVWMIKTIFVGYNDHLSHSSEYILNIRPLIFTVVDIVADFSIEGGTYDISFVSINNGTAKLSQYSNVAETVKLNLSNDTTLANAITKHLPNIINKNSLNYYNKVKDTVIAGGMNPKLVKYEFILDPVYHNANYKVDDSQQQNKTDGTSSGGCSLDFSSGITIENAIKQIMKHCSQVKEDALGKNSSDKYGYKIRSIMNSNKNEHKITYYIKRYKLLFSDLFTDVLSKDPEVQQQLEENTITFDYIYTGKNTDIIDFSMKMEMAFVFFNTIISSNTIGDQKSTLSGNIQTTDQYNNNTPETLGQNTNINSNPDIPIFFSTKIKNLENTNHKNIKDSTEFQSLLNRHAALESLNTKVKIHGNPYLLNSVNKVPSLYDVIEKVIIDNEDFAFPYWEQVPALARVNVFMPTTDDTSGSFNKEKFWYDGLYIVFKITNEFNDGLFTQELDMISIPNSINEEHNKSITKDKTLEQSSDSIVAKASKPLDKSKVSNFQQISDLANEIGPQYNIDPNLILAVIKQESRFNPNARSHVGALGLMQLLPSTAEDMGISRNDLFTPRQNIIAGTKYLQWLSKRHNNDVTLVLAAYNGGTGNVKKYNGVPPFKETQDYVKIVKNNYENFSKGTSSENKETVSLANNTEVQQSITVENNPNTISSILNILNSKANT